MLAFEYPYVPVFRAPSLADLDAIRALEVIEFEHLAYPYFVLRQLFELHGADWLVAEESGQLCGYVLTAPSGGGSAWFIGFAVSRACQGRGYGRALLESALARCRRADIEHVFVTVRPDNRAAYHLYETVGFTRVGHEAEYFGPGEARDLLVHDGRL